MERTIIKNSIDQLALFGNGPVFRELICVGRPNIGNKDRFFERVNDIFESKYLSNNGPYVQEFEKRITEMLGVKHSIAICNATTALQIAIRALGLNGEVVIPSFTFIATAHALEWLGIKPAFCDIDPATHNLDPNKIEDTITPYTTGIIDVHLWGRASDIESIIEIAHKHNLKLMFDAAHAFGCSYKGTMIGNFGEAEVFSFHATKFLNTFEGGVIATNNDDLAEKIRLMRNHGFSGADTVVSIGTNGKMSEISAAMGLTGLESIDEFIAVNHRNYKLYRQELSDIKGIKFIEFDEKEKNNYQFIVIEIDEGVTHVSRDQLIKILNAENIMTRPYFFPGCHRGEPYSSYFPDAGLLLPETEKLAKRVSTLPTGTSVGNDEIKIICQIIRLVIENGEELKVRLQSTNGR
jgi:dTDP-4-amino-4,6-dideoxygalactose transaminase